jgi:PKD repeat protein
MNRSCRARAVVLLLALSASGCTVKKSEPPAPSGPSELATSIAISASPDTLNQDGASQSQIGILVRDGDGQPVRGFGMRVDIALNGVVQDFGQLSLKSVTTGADGRAAVVYTAPASIAGFSGQTVVSIQVTPVGSNANAQLPRAVDIRLVPPGVIMPPGPRVPDFSISPSAPLILQQVQFDASDPALDSSLSGYEWSFGDGNAGTGRVVTHQYRSAGDVVVTLTVRDASGTRSSRLKTLRIGGGDRPKADFTFSPAAPQPGQVIFFNASASSAADGRHIARYDWDFGNGQTGTGLTTSLQYASSGSYNVTLTVTDNAGLTGVVTKPVAVTVP